MIDIFTQEKFLKFSDTKSRCAGKYAVSEEDRKASEQSQEASADGSNDPMQGLEGLDIAGPRPI